MKESQQIGLTLAAIGLPVGILVLRKTTSGFKAYPGNWWVAKYTGKSGQTVAEAFGAANDAIDLVDRYTLNSVWVGILPTTVLDKGDLIRFTIIPSVTSVTISNFKLQQSYAE